MASRKTPHNRIQMVYREKPASYNQRNKAQYQKQIASTYQRQYNGKLPDVDLYASVIYLYREDKRLDADNISKPLWDALNTVAYTDDRQIKARTAVAIDLNKIDFFVFDIDGTVEPDVTYDLMDCISDNDHTLLIEIGEIRTIKNLFKIDEIWK